MSSIINPVLESSPSTDIDIYLSERACNFCWDKKLGSCLITVDEVSGAYFVVWTFDAATVLVIGRRYLLLADALFPAIRGDLFQAGKEP